MLQSLAQLLILPVPPFYLSSQGGFGDGFASSLVVVGEGCQLSSLSSLGHQVRRVQSFTSPDRTDLSTATGLEFLPPYSSELQPAEHLWQLSDEPLVNRKLETLEELEETLATRCVTLSAMLEVIRQHTPCHWWKDG